MTNYQVPLDDAMQSESIEDSFALMQKIKQNTEIYMTIVKKWGNNPNRTIEEIYALGMELIDTAMPLAHPLIKELWDNYKNGDTPTQKVLKLRIERSEYSGATHTTIMFYDYEKVNQAVSYFFCHTDIDFIHIVAAIAEEFYNIEDVEIYCEILKIIKRLYKQLTA